MQSSMQSQKRELFAHKECSLAKYSTLGIGGAARFLIEVRTIDEAKEALRFAKEKEIPFFVVGKGSNCLFHDKGFNGLVIVNKIQTISYNKQAVTVGGGYNFSLLGVQTARKGLSGLEFASGIPGTVGGAVFMNAGANGAETKDALVAVVFLDSNGVDKVFRREELDFAYRKSPFQEMKGIIVEATFQLIPDQEARDRQIEIVRYRKETQPYGEKSAGCVFRNPQDGSAGALIDSCGFKGKQIGGALVSPKHANFLINAGGASAKEFAELAKFLQNGVFAVTGKKLEMEIREVPYDIPR